MAAKNIPHININQFLFGYDDGHRLISYSEVLPYESSSLLLMLSDLARGVTFQKKDYYWTGFPLQDLKSYALLKTWDAPEMSRPGCVWTHALVISFSDLARIKDLSVLKGLFKKPFSPSIESSDYSQPLQLTSTMASKDESLNEFIDSEEILKLLQLIYDEDPEFLLEGSSRWHFDENAWFLIWSQQWPKVRRDFVFRTSGTISLKYFPHLNYVSNIFNEMPLNYWVEAAYKDIRKNGKFREFLWRYGSDLEQGRNYFKILAYLYELSSESFSETIFPKQNLFEFLHILASVFPEAHQAGVIKSDIANLGEDPFSRLPQIRPFDLVEFYIRDESSYSLEPLTDSVFSKLESFWDRMYFEILRLTEYAIAKKSPWASHLSSITLRRITSDQFLEDAWSLQNVRKLILRNRPDMLMNSNLQDLSEEEFDLIVKVVKFSAKNLDSFISKVIKLQNSYFIELLLKKFPIQTLKIITFDFIDKLEKRSNTAYANIEIIKSNAGKILENGFIEHSRYTSTLFNFLNLYGLENSTIYESGSLTWARALQRTDDDLDRSDKVIFYAFLLTLAIKRPAKGCEYIFEVALIPIHNLLWDNNLQYPAKDLILSVLPQIEGVEWWDYCRKLRKTVTKVYVMEGLDNVSLNNLMNAKELQTSEPKALKPQKSDSKKNKQHKSNKAKKRFWQLF